MEDKKITEMFHARNETALVELQKKYGQLFNKLAFNILNNNEDAEECINDALVEIWNAIPPANPEYLMAFSCKIVRRVAINKLRFSLRQKRSKDDLPFDELSECLCGTDQINLFVESTSFRKVINDFVNSLDDESKALFIRRYFYCDSIKNISEQFGISENKISVRLHRIRMKLAETLKKEGFF